MAVSMPEDISARKVLDCLSPRSGVLRKKRGRRMNLEGTMENDEGTVVEIAPKKTTRRSPARKPASGARAKRAPSRRPATGNVRKKAPSPDQSFDGLIRGI